MIVIFVFIYFEYSLNLEFGAARFSFCIQLSILSEFPVIVQLLVTQTPLEGVG